MSHRAIGIAAAAIILVLLAAWLAMASMLFIWVHGFWLVYAWPDKLWMWARYADEGWDNAIVHRWLIITGIVAALPTMPVGLLACSLLVRCGRRQGTVYGTTGWATPKQMHDGGLRLREKL